MHDRLKEGDFEERIVFPDAKDRNTVVVHF